MPDDDAERLREWNKPKVVFLSAKEQFALVTLIRRVQKGNIKDVELLDSDSPILASIYERLAPDVIERAKKFQKKEDDQ